jgi:HK97 family phage major capsid protein
MEEEKKLTLDESVVKALEIMETRQAVKDEADAKEAELLEVSAKAAKFDEMEKEGTWAEAKKGVHIKKESELGFSDEPDFVLDGYLRGRIEENVAMKVLNEGTGTAGGVTVPTDWHKRLIELRDQASYPRRMGVQQLKTDRDNIDIPAEATSFTKFSRVAESGTYATNDPVFAQNNVIPQKWTKLTKVTDELLADNAYDLEGFLMRAYARAMAQTENYYVALGSGSSQHLGIFEGGDTDALTFDSGANITPDEIWELFYKLPAGYRGQANFLMNSSTWQYILSIRDANNWAFGAADMATIGASSEQPDGTLLGKPVYLQDDIPAISSATGVIAVGDPFYYALVDNGSLEIKRLEELYAATGQIGFRATFRQSGTVLYEGAWAIGVMA